MSKMRQRLPDGPVWVRTYPVTFLHDTTERRHDPDWHQLTFATRGHLEVVTENVRRIVPADRAVWVPAGTPHVAIMRAPISMRSIFVAAAAVPEASTHVRTIAVAPLLRELILHISRIGALDRRKPDQARLLGVLLDLLSAAQDVRLDLPSPCDPRARRFAELVVGRPGSEASIGKTSAAPFRMTF